MRRVWLALVIASLGWGTAGVATRATLNEGLEPYTLSALRAVIASLGILVYLAVRKRGMPRGSAVWRVGLVMGITNLAVPYIMSTIALQYVSAGFLGLWTALIPLFTALMAHYALEHESLSVMKVTGLLIGLAGVAALLLSGDSGLAEGGRPVFAGVMAIIVVISIAWGGVYSKRYAGEYRPDQVTGIHFISGSIVMVIAALVVEGTPASVSGDAWMLMAYMAIGSTVVPFILYYWMLQSTSATFASLAGYLVVFISVIAGMVFLDEQLQPGLIAGGALILLGVLIAERAERRPSAVSADSRAR